MKPALPPCGADRLTVTLVMVMLGACGACAVAEPPQAGEQSDRNSDHALCHHSRAHAVTPTNGISEYPPSECWGKRRAAALDIASSL